MLLVIVKEKVHYRHVEKHSPRHEPLGESRGDMTLSLDMWGVGRGEKRTRSSNQEAQRYKDGG